MAFSAFVVSIFLCCFSTRSSPISFCAVLSVSRSFVCFGPYLCVHACVRVLVSYLHVSSVRVLSCMLMNSILSFLLCARACTQDCLCLSWCVSDSSRCFSQTREHETELRETLVHDAFDQAVTYLNQHLPEDLKIRHIHWDFRSAAKKNIGEALTTLSVIAETVVDRTKIFCNHRACNTTQELFRLVFFPF